MGRRDRGVRRRPVRRRCLGEFLEASGEIQIADNPGAVEPLAEQRDLAAQGGDLGGQGGQAFAESLHG